MKYTKLLNVILLTTGIGLSACWGDEDSSAEPKASAAAQADYDFVRTLKVNCDDFPCANGPPTQMKMTEYNPNLIDFGVVVGEESEKSFKEKVRSTLDYRGQSEHTLMGPTTYVMIQKTDFQNEYLHRYDIVGEFKKNDDGKKVLTRWGTRTLCSPWTAESVWQTTKCPPEQENPYLFEKTWDECVEGKCVKSPEPRLFTREDFGKNLEPWIPETGKYSILEFSNLIQSQPYSVRYYSLNAIEHPLKAEVMHLYVQPHSIKNDPNFQSEYEIYFLFENKDEVLEWGARVRCAPVTETTPWQTTPC